MTSHSQARLGTSGLPTLILRLQVPKHPGDLDREHIGHDADLRRENTTPAEAETSSCRGDGVSFPQDFSPDRGAELETDAATISSPDRGDELETHAATMGLPGTDSGRGATSDLPAWILLDAVSYMDDGGDIDCDNSTTAECQTKSWREDGVKVSFFAADPPCPSYFSIHIPCLTEKPHLICGRPTILCSARNLALLSVTFDGYRSETEYYLYRVVGRGRRPLLMHLDYISQKLKEVIHVVSVGLLPTREGGFVLAAVALERGKEEQYSLHVFRFEQGKWTNKVHLLESHVRLYNIEKAIPFAEGELGFIDLWNGIIVFDLLQESLPRYIPLPHVLPGNHSDDHLGLSANSFRDVVFLSDGSIKCIEVELCWKVHEKSSTSDCTKSQKGVWESDILYDADLMHQIVDKEDEEVDESFEYTGWRFIAWRRSPNLACWRKESFFLSKDIVNTAYPDCCLDELFVSSPTLSMDGSELYLISKLRSSDLESSVIMVDLRKKALKEVSPPTKRPDSFDPTFILCNLFKYMYPCDGAEAGWDDGSASHTFEPNKESGVIKSNHYPSTEYYVCSNSSCFCSNQNGSQVYGQIAVSLRLPPLEHVNVLSVRSSQFVEKPSERAPVGLQLILLDD